MQILWQVCVCGVWQGESAFGGVAKTKTFQKLHHAPPTFA